MDEQPKISFEPPRGMRDFYPEDMVWRNRVFDAFRAAGEAAGFEPYDACVVESYELLARKAGEEYGRIIGYKGSGNKYWRSQLVKFLEDDPDLCAKLENKEIEPDDLKKIADLYNPGRK